jgi:hypothetical protein
MIIFTSERIIDRQVIGEEEFCCKNLYREVGGGGGYCVRLIIF